MNHYNNVSIAYAVVSLAGAFGNSEGEGRIVFGVLSRAPGDGAPAIIAEMASALRMELVDVRAPHIEYHPGAINAVVHDQFEKAVATGRPVLVVLDEAHGAQDGVLAALSSAFAKRVEGQPCAVLAISTTAGEKKVAEQLAKGLDWDIGRIVMHRTDDENQRILNRVLGAMCN